MEKQQINVWALGGASLKMLDYLESRESDIEPTLNVTYIDTSRSEEALIRKGMSVKLIDTGDGLAGSGAVKKTHHAKFVTQVPPIVNSVEPTDINFVVMSSSGASGSTIAYVVIEELLKEGKSVVLFTTCTPNALNRSKNTIKTLGSLDNLTKKYGVALPVSVFEGLDGYTSVDKSASAAIQITSAMMSNTILGIDDTDRKHFLNPCAIPDNQDGLSPGLFEMKVHTGSKYDGEIGIAGCMTLVPYGDNDNIGTNAVTIYPGQLTTEFVETFLSGVTDGVDAISLLLNKSSIYQYTKTLNDNIAELEKTINMNRVVQHIDVIGDDTDGCFL